MDRIHHAEPTPDSTRHTRRSVIALGCAACAAGLAGCLGGSDPAETPDPVAIGDEDTCDSCGMVIAMNAGANAQVFYADHEPAGHPSPALFDSLRAGLFPFNHERTERGWEATAVYATDYAAVDYEVTVREGMPFISSHLAADSFAPVDELVYVVGSEIRGAMGRDFVPFGDRPAAEGFAEEYGGTVAAYADLGPDDWQG